MSCDLLDFEPVAGAVVLPGRDFTSADTWREIQSKLGDRRQLDLVLSDMAPNVSGKQHAAFINITA